MAFTDHTATTDPSDGWHATQTNGTMIYTIAVSRSTGCTTMKIYVCDTVTWTGGADVQVEPKTRRRNEGSYIRTPVTPWHERKAAQVEAVAPDAPLARGKLKRWKSLKEKRQAWGVA